MQIENKEKYKEVSISALNFSTRTFNALMRANISSLYLLIENIGEVGKIRNMGEKSILEILDTLKMIKTNDLSKEESTKEVSEGGEIFNVTSLSPEILSRPATDLRVSVRICNSFAKEGIETIGQVLSLSPYEILHMKNMGALSQKHLLEEIEQLRTLGEEYFVNTESVDVLEEIESKYGKKEIDITTVKKLQESYGFKAIWLCDWYNISRQRVYQKLQKTVNHGQWCGKELLLSERNLITTMINTRSYYEETENGKYYLLNNMQDDCAIVIVSEDDIKCFFLADLPDALRARIKAENLHRFSEQESKILGLLGKKVFILKRQYFMPLDSVQYKNLAGVRCMSNEEYSQFLFGLPYCTAQTTVTDDKIIEFLRENTINGRTSIPSTPDNQWIRSYISRNGYSTNDFIEFYGFSVKGVEEDVIFDFTANDINIVEEDMINYPSDGDFVEKLFAGTPLLGSRIISQKNLETLYQNSRKFIGQLLNNSHVKPSLKAEMQIALAVINYAKGWDTEDESGFWRYITAQFGYRDDSGQLRNLLCNCIKNALVKNRRWFVTNASGNMYKSSILVHAFSTKKSWLHFCDFLFDFYKINLDWGYIEDDPMFARMIFALRNKLQDTDDFQDEDIEISTKIYYFREGIVKLILQKPKFAIQLAAKFIKRIDALVNHTAQPASCYEEQLCDEWMANKIQGNSVNRQREVSGEKRTVAIDYTRIKPIYQLHNESEIRIVFPDVRLAQNDFDSLKLTIYHDGNIVEQRKLSFYGNELGKTMLGFTLNLEDYLRRSDSKKFNPQVTITCGVEEIYNSEKVLFRECLVFRNRQEVDINSFEAGGYSIFVPAGITTEYVNAEVAEIKANAYIIGNYVKFQKDFVINLNGKLVAFDNAQNGNLRVMVPSTGSVANYIVNGICYNVVTGRETVHIISYDRDSEKKYRLVINDKFINLESLPYEESGNSRIYKIEIGNLGTDELSLHILDLANNRFMLRRYFKIIKALSYRFNRPFFFSAEDYKDAKLRLLTDNDSMKEYSVAQGDSRINIPYQEGELEIPIPTVKFIDNCNTEWNATKICWIKDIPQERFMYAKVPTGVSVDLLLNGQAVGREGNNAFSFGNALFGYSNTDNQSWLKITAALSVNGREPQHYNLGKIAVKEQFVEKPVLTMEGEKLFWDRGYGFIGDETGAFKLTICEDTEFEKTLPLNLETETIAEGILLPVGEYRYTISKQSGNLFSMQLQKIVSGSFFVGDKNELRFLKSTIQIDTITFEEEFKYEKVKIRTCYIDHIEYKGIQYVGSEDRECPVYNGILFFVSDSGKRHEYSYEDKRDDKGHQLYQVNPVKIVYINDSTLSITHETGDPEEPGDGFYYYRYYDKNAMTNIYQLTDWEPTRFNKDKYYLADLYSYTRKEVR